MNTTVKSKRAPKTADHTSANHPAAVRLARGLGCGLLAALIAGLALSLVGAAIAYASADPDALLWPLALGILGLISLICGFVTRRAAHLPPLPSGAASGLALVLLSFLLSYPFGSEATDFSAATGFALRGGILVFCLLGAAMGASLPKKRHKRSKRK